ncbi:hypothetical protein KDA23_01075 [Candidatus Saccharibacteria bacterium]|nr:hypothetical protein [Candidatus Saccharibacteria bacterium]
MKKCFKCNIEKPLSEFYKHKEMADGHLNKCKDCARADTIRQRNEVKPEYYRAYDKTRARSEKRRIWRRKRLREDRAANPLANKARRAVAYALSVGKLVKQPCYCGEDKVEAHHPDYNEPLTVVWLCNKHHKEIHGR